MVRAVRHALLLASTALALVLATPGYAQIRDPSLEIGITPVLGGQANFLLSIDASGNILSETAGGTGGTAAIEFVIDGGGIAITAGVKGDLDIPFACTIVEAVLLADQVGSIVVDVWKTNFAGFPPTAANSITGGTPPTISAAQKSVDTTLAGWTTAIAAADTLRYNVNSASSIQRVTLSLKVTRP